MSDFASSKDYCETNKKNRQKRVIEQINHDENTQSAKREQRLYARKPHIKNYRFFQKGALILIKETGRCSHMKQAKKASKPAAPVSAAHIHILSPEDRAAAGKALRDKVPREWQGGWKEFKGRPSPGRHSAKIGRRANERTCADPLWSNVAVAFCLLFHASYSRYLNRVFK
jgi:hypothetical protein